MPRIRPPRNGVPLPEPVEEPLPPTQAVEIEIDGDDSDGTEIELAASPEPEPQPEPAPTPAATPAPAPAADDNPLVRAAEAQRQAEEIARNAQRDRDEAIRQAQAHQRELERERNEREEADYNTVLTSLASEQRRLESARQAIRAAKTAGDIDAESDAIEQMTDAKAQISQFEIAKRAFESRRESRPMTSPQPQPAPVSNGIEQQIANMPIPDNAKAWLRNHQDYLTDPRKNAKLGAAHWDALDDAGGESQMGSARYIESLETRLGLRQAAPPSPAPVSQPEPQPQPQRRSMPVSAPVSRDVPTPSGERPSSTKITLTAEERAIAHNSFSDPTGKMTNADKERLYALGKKRMLERKSNGTYGQERQ